jgi:hypothetical protein
MHKKGKKPKGKDRDPRDTAQKLGEVSIPLSKTSPGPKLLKKSTRKRERKRQRKAA